MMCLSRYQTPHELKVGEHGIGFAVYSGKHHIGPELQIGNLLGDHFVEPVLLVKTCWGGKSLFKDFRPPTADGETGEFLFENGGRRKACHVACRK